jgi:D-sedoheptulose 7-phosphate isomerase
MAKPPDPAPRKPSATQPSPVSSATAPKTFPVPEARSSPSGWIPTGPGIRESLTRSLTEARDALDIFLAGEANVDALSAMSSALAHCFLSGNKVLACGNGGSACDAIHFAEEFTGRFRKHRRALPVIPLTDAAHMTCVANDYGYDEVFARGVEAYGKPGDLLLAISTSGNSANVIRAVETAKELGMGTLLFLGKTGGRLKGSGTHELIVDSETTERIQEIHMLALHTLIESVERALFPENYR